MNSNKEQELRVRSGEEGDKQIGQEGGREGHKRRCEKRKKEPKIRAKSVIFVIAAGW
jgi:hypothetical protein